MAAPVSTSKGESVKAESSAPVEGMPPLIEPLPDVYAEMVERQGFDPLAEREKRLNGE